MKYFQKFSNGFEPGTSMKLIQALCPFSQPAIYKIKRENLINERLSKKVLSILDNISFWQIFFPWKSKIFPKSVFLWKMNEKVKLSLKEEINFEESKTSL